MDEGDEPDEPSNGGASRGPIVALLVVVVLVLGGLWLSHRLRSVSNLQDCVMSGRTNCAPVHQ
jgi:hypothetical protein